MRAIDASEDLDRAHPGVRRAAIVFHGKARNVEGYYRALERTAGAAGAEGRQTVLIAPQFLREEDVEAHHLPSPFLLAPRRGQLASSSMSLPK